MKHEYLYESVGRYGGRQYEAVDGRLKWGYDQGTRFEFAPGKKFRVSDFTPRRKRHEGAVGIYLGCRRTESGYMAILECCGRKFYADAGTLVPWEGEITDEHLNLISARKKVHLLSDDHCACRCDSHPWVTRPALCIDEFLKVRESLRCNNCNGIAKTLTSGTTSTTGDDDQRDGSEQT
jgi:hypothetical protein